MAKLRIEIEENQFSLYDFEVYQNGYLLYQDDNYTSENAVMDAVKGLFS